MRLPVSWILPAKVEEPGSTTNVFAPNFTIVPLAPVRPAMVVLVVIAEISNVEEALLRVRPEEDAMLALPDRARVPPVTLVLPA